MSDKMNFQAEVGKLLDIVVNSLYRNGRFFAGADFECQRCFGQAEIYGFDPSGNVKRGR